MRIIDETGSMTVVTQGLRSFLEAAERHPRSLVVLRADVPPTSAELRRYCLALGGVLQFEDGGDVRSVRNDPTIQNSTAMSLAPLPLHTDGSFLDRPPERFLLSFSKSDPHGGGISTFITVDQILTKAPGWVLEALSTAEYLFVRSYDGNMSSSFVGPVLYGGKPAMRIRWRSDHIWRPKVVDPRGTNAEAAIDWLHDFLQSTSPLTYNATTGETLLVPNTVMLHGRTGLSADSPREVLRVWVA